MNKHEFYSLIGSLVILTIEAFLETILFAKSPSIHPLFYTLAIFINYVSAITAIAIIFKNRSCDEYEAPSSDPLDPQPMLTTYINDQL